MTCTEEIIIDNRACLFVTEKDVEVLGEMGKLYKSYNLTELHSYYLSQKKIDCSK